MDGGGACALAQLRCPRLNLRLDLFFLFDASQRLRNHLGRGFFEAAFACAAKVVGGFVQAKQRRSLFGEGGLRTEVLMGKVGKTKLVFRGEFPSELKLDGRAQRLRIAHQVGGRGLVELEQHMGALDLDPFAGFQLDLGRALGFGKDAARLEFSSFFKQCIHRRDCPTLGLKDRL